MAPQRHAVIAGTGRAGTSFLVRFLDACGLDTGIGAAEWHPRARAGLEHHLDSGEHLPYVVKDPWLFTYFRDIDPSKVAIDVLILPMRDLMSAAQSRVYQERVALIDRSPHDAAAQVVGSTPGGVLYSLDVVDQARILGVGFHNVLHWAVGNEMRLFLLSFPRIVEDCDYLLRTLWPWLGEHCEIDVARKAFSDTAASGSIRIDRDFAVANPGVIARGEPDRVDMASIAMAEQIRELNEIRTQLDLRAADAERERDEAAATIALLQQELHDFQNRANSLGDKLTAANEELAMAMKESAALRESVIWRLREHVGRHDLLYRLGRRLVHILNR